MKIHFYTKGDERIGDSRQRAMYVADELRGRGIDAVVHWPPVVQISTTRWPKKFFLIVATIRSLFSVKKGDIVFLQRTIGNKYFFVIVVAYLTLFRRKMIFDFDDAIYMHDLYKTKKLVQMADAVFVCSRALQTWVRQYNQNVHVFHTTVKLADYEKYTKDYSISRSPLIIGWVGTAKDHYKNLALLAEVFKKLPAKTPVPFKFLLVGVWGYPKIKELFEPIVGLNVEFVEYLPPGKMAETIQSFDIGVNPLVEKGEWNLARSSYKPYEYMACGLAQITSAVGEITYVVHDGVNGFLADTVEEWVEKLKKLIESQQLRAELGTAGQKTIREEESYEAVLPRMVDIIKNL
ncbi:MAG: Glycosyl transferase group 1 [Parcubacteria group bacterium GW2011_GWA1_47_11]|nr:MAG: Glycosyl transferase group 1 [Parcubacteria group bacterium GW2011_GWA1_47_11]